MSQELYTNGSIYLAPIGDRAINGFWIISCNNPKTWKYEPVGSKFYDAAHQSIYRNQHDFYLVDFESLKDTLPSIPTTYEPKVVAWSDNFPKPEFDKNKYPKIFQRLSQSPEKKMVFWIVLYEDLYESRFGDGKFLYYHKVFISEELATHYSLEHSKGNASYSTHIKEIYLRGDEVDLEAAMPQSRPFHYDLNKVLADLEIYLNQEAK